MSNAAKHRKKAAEYEQLKQIDRAITSYVKAIEESEAAGEDVDVALYNKVGDLALRQGRVPDAITYYERAVEHYATSGLFNNAIALCNKILRNAPGRANVYFTLGRISARKGLRGDATRNFLEYATRMQQEGRIEEGLRALAEVLDLMPELNDVRTMVDDLAARSGIVLPRRRTPIRTERILTPASTPVVREQKSQDLVFLDIDYGDGAVGGGALAPHPSASVVPAPVVPAPAVPRSLIDRIGGAEPPRTGEVGASAAVEAATATPALDGFTPDETTLSADLVDPTIHPSDVTWVVAPDAVGETRRLEEVISEEFDEATANPNIVKAIYTETPAFVPSIIRDAIIDGSLPDRADFDDMVLDLPADGEPAAVESLVIEPLEVESVPELDRAIQAGRELVERADAAALRESAELMPAATPVDAAPLDLASVDLATVDLADVEEHLPPTRPPFRLDPHDFILPGELPPLLLDDAVVEAGLAHPERSVPATSAAAESDEAADSARQAVEPGTPDAPVTAVAGDAEPVAAHSAAPISSDASVPDALELVEPADDEATAEDSDHRGATPWPASGRQVSVTPALPIAAVAEAAATVASSRRDALRAAVARLPKNWLLRRRLAEALFEAGERDAALHELETAQTGLLNDGEFAAASDIADELVHVSPDRIAYHQKRVELAVRLGDQQRLRLSYLDLADALVRLGEEGRARAVYVRVLEIDPHDDRARAALGAAAPPPPPPPPVAAPAPRPDDRFVDLADWLRDEDKPADTRMRMREPAISGDEQADFDALLRHFKEGVSRSLGEDDFESHYDLGVAYKEMGLLDDAIAEFQKALRSRSHRLPAYEALGQCFVEQGRFQVAATVLSRALHEPGLDDDNRVGVLYLLGYSCEALQRNDEARGYFQRVYATDINFRDVAARLAAIEQASR